MTAVSFAPLGISAVLWWALWRFNRDRGWFTLGEVLYWDAILLILVQLVWLRWF